jgi:Plant transposon protein
MTHPGARNDKTIVKFDGFVTKIHNGELYADVPFDLVDKEGKVTREKGLYLIVDGGYHKWKCLQCPFKHTSKSAEALWSRWVESVRKDVECTFGILKGRFRCLKLPIYYQDKDVIDSMFFTCCILHNILLHIDGYDVRWEKGVNWQGQDGHHEVDDMPSIVCVLHKPLLIFHLSVSML